MTWEPLQPHSASADNIAASAMCGAGAHSGDAEQPVRVRYRPLAHQLGLVQNPTCGPLYLLKTLAANKK